MSWSRFLYALSDLHAALSQGFALAAAQLADQPDEVWTWESKPEGAQ